MEARGRRKSARTPSQPLRPSSPSQTAKGLQDLMEQMKALSPSERASRARGRGADSANSAGVEDRGFVPLNLDARLSTTEPKLTLSQAELDAIVAAAKVQGAAEAAAGTKSAELATTFRQHGEAASTSAAAEREPEDPSPEPDFSVDALFGRPGGRKAKVTVPSSPLSKKKSAELAPTFMQHGEAASAAAEREPEDPVLAPDFRGGALSGLPGGRKAKVTVPSTPLSKKKSAELAPTFLQQGEAASTSAAAERESDDPPPARAAILSALSGLPGFEEQLSLKFDLAISTSKCS